MFLWSDEFSVISMCAICRYLWLPACFKALKKEKKNSHHILAEWEKGIYYHALMSEWFSVLNMLNVFSFIDFYWVARSAYLSLTISFSFALYFTHALVLHINMCALTLARFMFEACVSRRKTQFLCYSVQAV